MVEGLFDTWRFDEALAGLAILRAQAPSSLEVLYLEGYERFLAGDYPAAVVKLQLAMGRKPGEGGAARGNVKGLLELAAAAGEVIQGHQERRSTHFLLRFPPEDEVLAEHGLKALEAMVAALKEDLGFVPKRPIIVDIYRHADDLAAVSPLTVAEVERTGTIALCKWARLMATSPRALRFGYPWLDTLSHELVHYAVSELSHDQVPVWLQEGLAKFLEKRWRDPPGGRLPPSMEHLLAKALRSGKLISFEAMHPSMAKLPRAEDAGLAFAEVATAVAFLHQQGGMPALQAAVAAARDGTDARDAVAAASKLPWKTFEKRWSAFMRAQGYRTFDNFEPIAPKLRKRAAVDSKRGPNEDEDTGGLGGGKATRFLRLGNMLLLRRRPQAAALEYEKGAKIAGPSEWLFPIKLGRTYLALREPDRALSAVANFQRLYPELPWPHLIAGRALLQSGRPAEAVPVLEQALANNPFDPEVHCALRDAYEGVAATDAGARTRAERAQRYCRALAE